MIAEVSKFRFLVIISILSRPSREKIGAFYGSSLLAQPHGCLGGWVLAESDPSPLFNFRRSMNIWIYTCFSEPMANSLKTAT
jgi:hypothetical protein